MIQILVSTLMLAAGATASGPSPQPGTLARYAVLTCKPDVAPPFERVDLIYGPKAAAEGTPGIWLQIQARAKDQDGDPAVQVQVLVAGDLLRSGADSKCLRYLLQIPATGEALDYRNVHTGAALLPPWSGFQQGFLPHAARGTAYRDAVPETVEYLGQVLTLTEVRHDAAWKPIQAKRLDLDPELLVGTARNFKDAEGHRLPKTPERKDYTDVPFTAGDYQTMIAAGSNIFMIAPDQEQYVRDEPVFYVCRSSNKLPMRWPADLCRSNFLGTKMFLDEPAIITVGDRQVNTKMRFFSDFAAVLQGRVSEEYGSQVLSLDKLLRDRKTNLGSLRLEAPDCPVWETLYETSFYQMAAGASGTIHEGRYHLDNFTKEIATRAGIDRKYTVEEMLRYYYSTLRGGARPFGKDWGTSIYGQCDPKISPVAVTQAYDMGARYIWFWTSDHEHHLPWSEQMELTRTLRRHAQDHPRSSIAGSQPPRDLAIAAPYPYFVSLENLWFIRGLDPKGENDASVRYRRLLSRAFRAMNEALDKHEDFDITVDDGRQITGYKRVVRLTDEP